MATKLKEVDVVIVGLGWTGGILAKELTRPGLKVVALERGANAFDQGLRGAEHPRRVALRGAPRPDAEHGARHAHDPQQPIQEALPMRRLGSFLPGEGVGGSGVHWSGHHLALDRHGVQGPAPCTRSVTARNSFPPI